MRPDEAARIRQSLLDTRTRLLAEGAIAVRRASDDVVASAADEDEAPHHEMDQAIASSRNKERAARLAQVEDALARLADDPESYGLCEACEEPIAAGRLVAMPFARLCVDCQASRDANPHGRGRKKVTDYR